MGQKEDEAKIYYLYMMSDGQVSHDEERIFDKLCKELEIDEDTKKAIVSECKKLVGSGKTICDIIQSEQLEISTGCKWFRNSRDSSVVSRVIWNLVSLGYADTDYSEEEKKIVNYLINQWEIKPEVYQEMIDTADTILALTNQKEWVVSTFSKTHIGGEGGKKTESEIYEILTTRREQCRKKVNDIEEEIGMLLSDMELTIAELTV